ncbi:hypothetical protein BH23GEM1_BH23GEM1_02190 [soil metagenome]
MPQPPNPRRLVLSAARKYIFDNKDPERFLEDAVSGPHGAEVPRLTPNAIEKTRMPRSRDRILTNLEEMYREAFERARASGDDKQMATLDFAYRREQLYFEVLLDVRDALDARR